MEENLLLSSIRFSENNYEENYFNRLGETVRRAFFSKTIINIIAEAGENFLGYLKNMGLSDDPDLVILSSKDHYNYKEDELLRVRTLVNRKKLNLIKHLDAFLFMLFRVLPRNANFIGCFSDCRAPKFSAFDIYRPYRIINRIISFLDSSSRYKIDKNDVSKILRKNGFTIVDMTEKNGLTYFYSQKVTGEIELSA